MPIRDIGDRIRRGAVWLWRGVIAGVTAIGRLPRLLLVGIFHLLRGIWRLCYWCVAIIATGVKVAALFIFGICVGVGTWIFRQIRHGIAWCRRYGAASLVILFIAGVGITCWWYRCELSDFLHHLLRKQKPDTEHATWYYAVNVIFLPLQTALLVIGGFYAWLTLRQSSRFKQHDVEARCVSEYMAVERKMHAATNEIQMKAAARAYWTLIVYEYHWWRQGLISRELFTVWSAFHMQKFKPDTPGYTILQTWNLRRSFRFARQDKVFRSPSSFARFIRYLIVRARDPDAGDLKWHQIERFRHGCPPHF